MRIGVDFTPAVSEQAGIGRLTRELFRAVLEIDDRNEYVFVAPKSAKPPDWITEHPRARWATLPVSAHTATVLWHRLGLPISIERFTGPIDIFHGTDYLLPPLNAARGIVTVHDLSYRVHPEFAEPSLVRYLDKQVPDSLHRAALVLADSESTRQDIIEHYHIDPERITVVYGGVRDVFRPIEDPVELTRVRACYALPDEFLLTVSRLEPRKNLPTLFRSYRQLLNEHEAVPPLLVGGGKGWQYESIFSTVEELGLTKCVRFLGFVADEDLPGLLTQASIFLYPSFYEGFGLPPLEAMACRTPVIAANTSSLPEVLGDAALQVSPTDVDGLARAITLLLHDDSLRQTLSERGLAQAKRFTWQAAARELLHAYESVAATPAGAKSR